jgi:glycosyltransferase involved in cell wall biosynthesis
VKQSLPVRVAFCVDTFDVGGTELNAVRTAEAIDPDRIELTVFHFQKDGPLRRRYEALGLRLIHQPISGFLSIGTLMAAARFNRTLRDLDINIVHAHDLYTNIFYSCAARLSGRRRMLASRRWWYDSPRPALTPVNRWATRSADAVLANSEGIARLLVDEEGVREERVSVIPNFLDDASFCSLEDSAVAECRRQWKVPADCFVVGCVARLAPVKNHSDLLVAASTMPESVHVVLVGDGPSRAELEHLAAQLGIAWRVHFIGQVLGDANLHRYFDVSVLCSLSEGFPNAVIEAMAASKPVVATAVGGVADIVSHDVNGLLVQPRDQRALAAELRKLLDSPSTRQRLGAAGHALVSSRYRREPVIDSLSSLYESLATS